MTCPRCGRPADPSLETCPACHAPLHDDANLEATDVGTPLDTLQGPQTPAPREGIASPITPHAAVTPVPRTPVPASGHAGGRSYGGALTLSARGRTQRASSSTAPRHGHVPAIDLVGRQLGDRYHIIKLLGAGGMGAVYQAWDNELGVTVALKTVRKELAADPETAQVLERRFKQELLLARKVTHKNIVRVHDIGELEGITYITMPYLEGEDLATILRREGRLPVRRVLRIARSVVSGLAAAHDAGVVHRDLKPANIMVNAEGEGLVMDFGVARSTDAPATAGTGAADVSGSLSSLAVEHGATPPVAQTLSGTVVGTIEYMAPEQSRGETVDQRADLYAFGLILYDLLGGRARSERAKSAVAELQQRMREAPPSLRLRDAAIPADLDAIVLKCVQPDAQDRWSSSRALEAALARLDDDGHARPEPAGRRVSWPVATAAGVVLVGLLGGTWWAARPPAVPEKHEPVSILIADLQNETGDPAFDGTLEPMLKLALEGAGFISAYDRSGIRRSLGVAPPDQLDENAGRELAVKQGVGVVLSGSLARAGTGYAMTLRAAETVTGNVLAEESAQASTRQDVLATATDLGNRVRTALGDVSSDSARRFATETLSATSLDVVRDYAQAMLALSNSQFADARTAFGRAVAQDPNFGLAYAGMAIATSNMGQPQEAEKYVKEAIRHVDRMTERERFRTRGLLYYLTNDYEACVKEYGDLLAQYEADVAARNNLALCSTKLRQMGRARDEMRRVVAILPRRSLYRVNTSLYSTYAGDFTAADQEAVIAQQLDDPWANQALALARLGQGDFGGATTAYEALGRARGAGPSYTASGLADIALHQGRFADASRLFADGAAADLAAGDPDRAAIKFVSLAYTELSRGRPREAVAAADRAVSLSTSVQVRFLAGRIYAEGGALSKAEGIATDLSRELHVEPQAYGTILQGVVALARDDARTAVRMLTDANGLLDTWIGHFDLGRAYLAAGAFPQADSEFDRCLKRSGEALSLFLDEEPTSGYLPPVYYYLGRAREGLGTAAYGDAYRRYLALRHQAQGDPLVADISRRLAGR